ncbi:hypothetical protein HYT52_05385 [Candidatus Woesearchaeota archaeon]|nr:hypothetical protein [Candidatus Woesearchaeota archaeon]
MTRKNGVDELVLLAGQIYPEPLRLNEDTRTELGVAWDDSRLLTLLYSGLGGCNISYSSRQSVISLTERGIEYYQELRSREQR